MAKKGTRSVLVYNRPTYDLIATFDCHIFAFLNPPEFDEDPLVLMNGEILKVGDCIVSFDSKKTSAGFPGFRMKEGNAVIFAGTYPGEDNEKGRRLVCFDRINEDGLVPAIHDEYPRVCFGFTETPEMPGVFFFSTPAVAGRVVETTRVVRWKGGKK
ncbi:conserved hypothetical protein [Gammaproteobacteria bacterium]